MKKLQPHTRSKRKFGEVEVRDGIKKYLPRMQPKQPRVRVRSTVLTSTSTLNKPQASELQFLHP